jgi:hypothetical protein
MTAIGSGIVEPDVGKFIRIKSSFGAALVSADSRAHGRWARPIAVGLTVLGLAIFAFFMVTILTTAPWNAVIGEDRRWYQEAALRWLHGGFWYYPEQVAGPYVITPGHVLYPPVALVWLVPAAFLPDVLWWGIPLVVTAAIVWWHRPSVWAWPIIAVCLAYSWSAETIAVGGLSLWVLMFVALGTRWRPFFALVFLKPSLFPLALLGVRSRGWWVTAISLLVLSLAFLPMDLDYLRVLVNARGPLASLLYSGRDLPILAIPVAAWAAGRERSGDVIEATHKQFG